MTKIPSQSCGTLIIIPFYKNEQLVRLIGQSLAECKEELKTKDCKILLINDSPEYEPLMGELEKLTESLKNEISTELLVNKENLGFIKTTNIGLERARATNSHALLLNSDTEIFPNAITELHEILQLDPMIGFVNPRSNNATICSLPPDSVEFSDRSNKERAVARYREISKHLPRFQFAPTGVGFCLLIRNSIVSDFGLLDEVYGRGYNEENDYIFRANRCGFRVALANKAYVFHSGSISFGTDAKNEHERKNSQILLQRYPEYHSAIASYFESTPYLLENLYSNKAPNKVTLAIDCSTLAKAHNGTFKATREIVRSIALQHPNLSVTALCSREVAEFHGLIHSIPNLLVKEITDTETYDILLKIGQPFSFDEIKRAAKKAESIFYTMLDTIAWDCLYLRHSQLDALWKLTAEHSNGLLFISDYSKQLFNERFPGVPPENQYTCWLSLKSEDYLSTGINIPETIKPVPNHYLVFGNHYAHKYLVPTLHQLAGKFPDSSFTAFGLESFPSSNVKCVKAGELTDLEIEVLYREAEAIIFPSQYEGFGFPVVESLARGKTVFCRDTELNRQLLSRWKEGGNAILYRSNLNLEQLLRDFQKNKSHEEKTNQIMSDEDPLDYAQIAKNIVQFIQSTSPTSRYEQAHSRLSDIEVIQSLGTSTPQTDIVTASRLDPLVYFGVKLLHRLNSALKKKQGIGHFIDRAILKLVNLRNYIKNNEQLR